MIKKGEKTKIKERLFLLALAGILTFSGCRRRELVVEKRFNSNETVYIVTPYIYFKKAEFHDLANDHHLDYIVLESKIYGEKIIREGDYSFPKYDSDFYKIRTDIYKKRN
ncbi:hypothetical protein HYW75_01865 [Candidatus Pacearchaeota archaeon]|nr:hypothetical protein [Candidatus Pacearchaeota archaeon]